MLLIFGENYLPHERDQNAPSGTLPPSELNPLLNPLLAENMGRWAEVYFTSPPEHREQAVLKLLRELEAEKSRQEQDSALMPSSRGVSTSGQQRFEISRSQFEDPTSDTGPMIHCGGCGRDNPAPHRFCGMCGAPLVWENPDSSQGNGHAPVGKTENPPENESSRPQWRTESSPRDFELSHSNGNELSLFQSSRNEADEGDHSWAYEPEPAHPYRFYLGAILAVIILVLGYMAWRGMQTSQNAHQITAPPPAPVNDTSSAPPSSTDASPTTSPSNPAQKAVTASPSTGPVSPPAAPKKAEAENIPEPAAAKPTATAPATTASGNGSEELGLAQHYLNGTNGQGRDTAEAAKWLWKSIAKHNGEATVLLADLYLRGDGVPKNCDQARVLLDSAARKGIGGAGERLRNLQAFGCQ